MTSLGVGPETPLPDDAMWVTMALALARRGLGRVAPNPAVGCVLVRDGQVVARGWTQPGGRPHAETMALGQAGDVARGTTAYVTLEPCSHTGATGPCAQALIDAGVARVVSALEDPDPRVSGQGHAMLRAAGIPVTVGPGADVAREVNAGFLMKVEQGRPLVTLKLATTLDGKSATSVGESQWITGPEARAAGQMLRATNDAIVVGIGTALADDPQLTCRLPGLMDRSPVRVVCDSALRIKSDSKLVRTAQETPTWVICREDALDDVEDGLRKHAVDVARVAPEKDGSLDLEAVLLTLGSRGITRVLIESGGRLATSFLRGGWVDQLVWFRAASVLGADARSAIGALEISDLIDSPRFVSVTHRKWGDDTMDIFRRID